MAVPVKPIWDLSDIERERQVPDRLRRALEQHVRFALEMREAKSERQLADQAREDLIEALLAEYEWSISRDEAARVADRIIEREMGK